MTAPENEQRRDSPTGSRHRGLRILWSTSPIRLLALVLVSESVLVGCPATQESASCTPDSTLTVEVDTSVAMGTATSSGACTELDCVDSVDNGGCSKWEGQMTSIDASCDVTFTTDDGGTTSVQIPAGQTCGGHPAAHTVLVGEGGIYKTI